MHEEQAKLKPHDMPKLLAKDIAQKAGDLDREVKYLLGKLKSFKPKKAKETTSSKDKKTNDTKKDADDDAPKFDIPPPPEDAEEKKDDAATGSKSKKTNAEDAGSEEPLELEGEIPVEGGYL
jgi:hypoxia up-regulated 1